MSSSSKASRLTILDLAESRAQHQSITSAVEALPEGFVKTELAKSMARLHRKIEKEEALVRELRTKEPMIARIEGANITVTGPHDVVVLTIHAILLENGFVAAANEGVPARPGAGVTGAGAGAAGQAESSPAGRAAVARAAQGEDDAAGNAVDYVVVGDSGNNRCGSYSLGIPASWNGAAGVYALQYTHRQFGKDGRVSLKCLAMGQTLSSHLMVVGDDSTILSNDLLASDYACKGGSIRAAQVASLRHLVTEKMINPLLPSPPSSSSSSSGLSAGQKRQRLPTAPPGNIGRTDAPMRQPFLGGGLGADLDPFNGAMGRAGGMQVGPNHPIFGGGGGGGMRGAGFPAGVPPGARFDPFGPVGGPRPGPGGWRGGRGLPGRGDGPRRGGGGMMGPGPDHLEPPGMGGMDMSFM